MGTLRRGWGGGRGGYWTRVWAQSPCTLHAYLDVVALHVGLGGRAHAGGGRRHGGRKRTRRRVLSVRAIDSRELNPADDPEHVLFSSRQVVHLQRGWAQPPRLTVHAHMGASLGVSLGYQSPGGPCRCHTHRARIHRHRHRHTHAHTHWTPGSCHTQGTMCTEDRRGRNMHRGGPDNEEWS